MNKIERKFNPNDYTPKRFGLKYSPPQIIIEYLVTSSGKLYHHKIKLNKFKPDSNLQEVVKEIYEKHYMYLDGKKITPTQMVRLVEKLSNVKSKQNEKEKEQKSFKNEINNLDDEENYNDFVEDFDGDNFEESKENREIKLKTQENKENKENSSPLKTNQSNKVDINELDDEDEDYYKFFDYEKEDLNKLDSDQLQKRKDAMEKLYSKNAVLPNDDKFVFDVRVRIILLFF